jgi:hypothetical protein
VVRLRIESDLTSTLKVFTDLDQKVEKVGDTLGKAAGEAKKLELAAKRIVDANLTPQERYNQKVELLSKAFVQGRVKVDDMDRSLARMRQRMDEAGNAQNKIAGPSALRQIIDYASSWFGAAAAIGAVTAALRAQREISKEAAAGLTAGFEGRAALQLVATSQQDYNRLQKFSTSLISRGVVKQGPEGDITAGLVKAGLTSAEMAAVAKLAADDKIKSGEMVSFAEAAKGAQRVYGLSSFDEAAATLIAGARGSRLTPSELGTMVLRFGEGTRKLPFAEAVASSLAIVETTATSRATASRLEQMVGGKQKFTPGEAASRAAHLQRLQGVGGLAKLPDFRDRNLDAENLRQEAQGRLDVERMARGRRDLLFQSLMAEEEANVERSGYNAVSSWLGRKFLGATNVGVDWALQRANQTQPDNLSPGLLEAIRQELETQTRVMGGDARPPRPAGRQEN